MRLDYGMMGIDEFLILIIAVCYLKAQYIEACLEDVTHAVSNSRGLPAKQVRLVTKCPVDAAGIDRCKSGGSLRWGN